MWQWVKVSSQGTSHIKFSTPCQDCCAATQLINGGEEWLFVAVADGAGSASHAEQGSEFVVTNTLQLLTERVSSEELDESEAKDLINQVRNNLSDYAKSLNVELKDTACTILVAGLSKSRSFFIQIGDGCWVIRSTSGFSCPTWPFNGDFANETKFITSPDFNEFIQFKSIDDHIDFVAGFTDGIQSLVLDFSSQEPHAGFFIPLIESFQKISDTDKFEEQLRNFLNSDAVNNRTDDDKTLFLGFKQ